MPRPEGLRRTGPQVRTARIKQGKNPRTRVNRNAREWMGIEPTKRCGYNASTALKAAGPTRRPDTPSRGPHSTRSRETHGAEHSMGSFAIVRHAVVRRAARAEACGSESPRSRRVGFVATEQPGERRGSESHSFIFDSRFTRARGFTDRGSLRTFSRTNETPHTVPNSRPAPCPTNRNPATDSPTC